MSSGLELLKQAMENRRAAGVSGSADKKPNSKVTPTVQPVGKSSSPDAATRASIIENKPKNKVVKKYFEAIVEKVVDYVDNEED